MAILTFEVEVYSSALVAVSEGSHLHLYVIWLPLNTCLLLLVGSFRSGLAFCTVSSGPNRPISKHVCAGEQLILHRHWGSHNLCECTLSLVHPSACCGWPRPSGDASVVHQPMWAHASCEEADP